MRKWQDLAAPDDPGSWYAVGGMWPTRRGTYETADISSATTAATLGSGHSDLIYAFAYGTSSGSPQEYILHYDNGNEHVYTWDGTTLTSIGTLGSGGGTVRGSAMMARYGDVTLLALKAGSPTIYAATSFGGAFSQISGAPTQRNILAICSTAVLAFSTGANTWYASDVGDYTNWTTGEAANGTLYNQPGTVSTAVAYGNSVYVFKQGNISRMTYVGGVVKWQVETAWVGNGIPQPYLSTVYPIQDWAIATNHGIAFYGGNGAIYLFDGVSSPVRLNPYTTIPVETILGVFTYDPSRDVLCIAPSYGSSATGTALVSGSSSTFTSLYYYYDFATQAWGSGYGSAGELQSGTGQSYTSGVLRGNYYSRSDTSSKPVFWNITDSTSGVVKRCAPADPVSTSTCYLQTSMVGKPDRKSYFYFCKPLLRRRTDLGTDSAALSVTLWRELDDSAAQSTNSVTESTYQKQFDFALTDNFARCKVTWTDLDVEVDDFLVKSKDAGDH